MRPILVCALLMTCVACGQPPTQPDAPTPAPASQSSTAVNPARIERVRQAMPDGYEFSGYDGAPTPMATWGLRGLPVSDPPQCVELGAPAVDASSARGWSASGPAGIVYAVIADAEYAAPDAELLGRCGRWTAVAGHTTATVIDSPGPVIEAAGTVGMSATTVTVVEGGTETRSHAETFVAHLGNHVCFVAVVTDPGSPDPTLDSAFAAELLVETVSTLRG